MELIICSVSLWLPVPFSVAEILYNQNMEQDPESKLHQRSNLSVCADYSVMTGTPLFHPCLYNSSGYQSVCICFLHNFQVGFSTELCRMLLWTKWGACECRPGCTHIALHTELAPSEQVCLTLITAKLKALYN